MFILFYLFFMLAKLLFEGAEVFYSLQLFQLDVLELSQERD